MTRALWLLGVLAGCGFGLADDSGAQIPDASYWGWQSPGGSAPPQDAGCLPETCADGSAPSTNDAGRCACADGTEILGTACTGE